MPSWCCAQPPPLTHLERRTGETLETLSVRTIPGLGTAR